MPGSIAETHPRPQMTRARWVDLGSVWQFAYDDADHGLNEDWVHDPARFDRAITVPFPPESSASGIGDNGFHPVVWYRRTFRVAPEDRAGRMLLHFGAVDYHADVWVNGTHVATHGGGHTPFSADITNALRHAAAAGDGDSEEHVVIVRAADDPHDLAQPRGKQDWQHEPHRIYYKRTTGIWQPVWLEPVPDTHIVSLRWTPDIDRATVTLDLTLNRTPAHPVQARIRLALRGTLLAESTFAVTRKEARHTLSLDAGMLGMERNQTLWSPEFPNLVDATVSLATDDELSDMDVVESYIGLRSTGIGQGRFLLNGRAYYLRMVLEQGYWPTSHLAAPDAAALRYEVELIKALGFNGARIHQKVEDPRFLYWCDRLGLVVWGEMANAFVYTAEAVERLTREWLEVVRRDASHPCIVAWVPINESWGVPAVARDPQQQAFVRALYHLTHALDATRPVIGNDGWEQVVSDVWGIHDYSLNGAPLAERYGSSEAVTRMIAAVQPGSRTLLLAGAVRADEPVMLTEFGGISFAPDTGEQWFGYGTVAGADAYLARYRELLDAVLASPVLAGFCYTQLTDTEQETNGLLTADRVPKLPLDQVHAITARPSAAVPGEIITMIQAAAEKSAERSAR